MSDRPPELATMPVIFALPIQWGDQDAFGHVNGVIYFRWFESARVEYLNQAGLGSMMSNQGVGPILASIRCDYRRQLSHPDTLQIGASITAIGRTSLKMSHVVYSAAQASVAALGESTIVVFDYASQKPVPVPADVRAKIEAIEGHSFGERDASPSP